jgi:hypothetical protein
MRKSSLVGILVAVSLSFGCGNKGGGNSPATSTTVNNDTITIRSTVSISLDPVLNAIGAKSVNVGTNLNFTISGSDPDGDTLTYSATGLPAGATFNADTRTFEWTPGYTQAGSYNVTFAVNDGSQSATETVTITVITSVSLKGPINIKVSSLGYVEYLGQIINVADYPVCFVKMTIDSKDFNGNLIDTAVGYVEGSTMVVLNSIYPDTCLQPGELGGFDIYTHLHTIPASYTYAMTADNTNISEPIVSPSQVIIDQTISETTETSGNLKLLGFVKNLHSTITLRFVKISLVALYGEKVVDTEFTYINGSSCEVSPGITTSTCLSPGDSRPFSVPLDVPPGEVSMYYYKINFGIVD